MKTALGNTRAVFVCEYFAAVKVAVAGVITPTPFF
jgi:hypothetical protein